jgi:hypothetical protein
MPTVPRSSTLAVANDRAAAGEDEGEDRQAFYGSATSERKPGHARSLKLDILLFNRYM